MMPKVNTETAKIQRLTEQIIIPSATIKRKGIDAQSE
jgi:hypothetical protein